MTTPLRTVSDWFKSSFSTTSAQCVEVRFHLDSVLIRDSKYLRDPANAPAAQPVITVAAREWHVFLDNVVSNETESADTILAVEYMDGGRVRLRSGDRTTLTFSQGEWSAFLSGVKAQEFSLVRSH
ncbi:DUF397 domain-containing protein [Nocardia seriolae]|uniref:DUF397 domain-containing protein n=1 Tax=Nocardia seriolae TaxID=37332 RepID=UPI001F3E7298|nr:DUF397 domain-containing protein [Nocardia seriolae]